MPTIKDRTRGRLYSAALAEFKRLGLDAEAAHAEAESFAYTAAELLSNRLGEAEVEILGR